MREIKFRAWVKPLKKMTAVNGFISDTVFLTADTGSGSRNLIDVELMQFTGLRDKNGVEIYEGDIVRILYTDWMSKDDNDPRTLEEYLRDIALVRLVEWNYNGFYVTHKAHGYHETMEHGTHGYIEVIGNIYEHP